LTGEPKLKSDSKKQITFNGGQDAQPVSRQIKDGVFKLLFEIPENAAELYYALKGVRCNPDEIEIITITTAISGKLKNDLAFVVRNRAMVVGEHMSSPYANMPVRFLMYTGQLYEKWIKMKGEIKFLYGSKLYKIPTPEFVVFYNGTAQRPEKESLCLSSAFIEEADKRLGALELEIPVYNINKGMNVELFKKSPMLRQYAEFIAKIRELIKLYDDYTQAVSEAANYCIANDILSNFLKKQGGKIVSILSMEYDEEIAKRVYGEELIEDERERIALKLLRRNRPISEIVEDTGLSRDDVERLCSTV
jgi:hypothetical protein